MPEVNNGEGSVLRPNGAGPRMNKFKPQGERGPTVFRDMTGIAPEHLAKLANVSLSLQRRQSDGSAAGVDCLACTDRKTSVQASREPLAQGPFSKQTSLAESAEILAPEFARRTKSWPLEVDFIHPIAPWTDIQAKGDSAKLSEEELIEKYGPFKKIDGEIAPTYSKPLPWEPKNWPDSENCINWARNYTTNLDIRVGGDRWITVKTWLPWDKKKGSWDPIENGLPKLTDEQREKLLNEAKSTDKYKDAMELCELIRRRAEKGEVLDTADRVLRSRHNVGPKQTNVIDHYLAEFTKPLAALRKAMESELSKNGKSACDANTANCYGPWCRLYMEYLGFAPISAKTIINRYVRQLEKGHPDFGVEQIVDGKVCRAIEYQYDFDCVYVFSVDFTLGCQCTKPWAGER
ncbi:MAG: hypothetical protein KBG84_14085 [Planctomycetes bacterium]|nr:hypothetical protein [Planctomycetota bacterium]